MTILLIVGVLLLLAWSASAGTVRQANEDLRVELGDAYNEDAAGHPWRDGGCLLLVALLFGLFALSLAGSILPVMFR